MGKLLKLLTIKNHFIGHIAMLKFIIKMESMIQGVYLQIFKIIK